MLTFTHLLLFILMQQNGAKMKNAHKKTVNVSSRNGKMVNAELKIFVYQTKACQRKKN